MAQLQAMCAALPAAAPHRGIRHHLPSAAAVVACGVECDSLSAGQRPVGSVCGFDLTSFNALRAATHYDAIVGVPLWAHPHRRLTETAVAQSYSIGAAAAQGDSMKDDEPGRQLELKVLPGMFGTCHAIAVWIENEVVSGAPDACRPWQCQGLRLLQTPRQLVAGESVHVIVRRREGGARLELNIVG